MTWTFECIVYAAHSHLLAFAFENGAFEMVEIHEVKDIVQRMMKLREERRMHSISNGYGNNQNKK